MDWIPFVHFKVSPSLRDHPTAKINQFVFIKAQTHSNTVGIHVPTGDFGQDLQRHTADRVSARIRVPVCSVETVMIAHRLGR